MKFDPVTRTTDILMFNSKNLGALIVKQDPQVVSWEDNRYGIQEMAIDEHYGLGIINEGQAIATMKNVKVRPNEFVLPARSVFNLNESGSTFESIDGVVNFGALAVLPLVKTQKRPRPLPVPGTSPLPTNSPARSPAETLKAFHLSHFQLSITWHTSTPHQTHSWRRLSPSQITRSFTPFPGSEEGMNTSRVTT
jgi:hypothetical protein